MDTSDKLSLHSAVKSDDLEATEMLLREGVAICTKNKNGLTPQQILIQKKVELFDALLAKENEEFSNFFLTAKVRKELEEADAKKERHPSEHLYSYREMDQQRQEEFNKEKENSLNAIREKIAANDKFIDMLLKYKRSDSNNCPKDMQLLNFHLACTLKNPSFADKFSDQIGNIDESLSEDTSFYPGYTALHFAAHCNADIVKMLVTKGANLLNPDAKGVTSLDICIKSFSIEELQSIMSLIPAWRNLLFSNGSTKLMDYLTSLHDPQKHKEFVQKNIKASLPKQSPFWPGYTMLHIAVILLPNPSCGKLLGMLTLHSDLVTIQSSDGSTPVHLAFRHNKSAALKLLLNKQKKAVNPLDRDKLSHLHIASSINNQKIVKVILKSEVNVNVAYEGQPLPTVKPGWTPLHTAVYTSHAVVARLLLQRGANLLQTDARGFTAIHLLPDTMQKGTLEKLSEVLFAPEHQLEERVVEGVGLTHLHVLTWRARTQEMNRLIDSKSDIEATIGKLEEGDLKRFEGCRPIHIAMLDLTRPGVFFTLLKRGADVFAKNPEGSSPLREILTGKYSHYYLTSFADVLWSSEALQIRMMEELGITMLHVACYAFDKDKIRELLEKKVDVNARTRDDSSIWPGFTPLHVLVFACLNLQHDTRSQETADGLCELLFKAKADVTLTNAEGDTPAFMALKTRYTESGFVRASFLMKHQLDFRVNPENKAGMSHFHLACLLSEIETVKKFLEHGHVDVNRGVNSSEKGYQYAGQTPLHLALSSPRAKKHFNPESQVQMIDLLLEFGADVHADDAIGHTALHKLASSNSNRNLLMKKMLIDDKGIGVNKRGTHDGKTPLEILLWNGASFEEVKYFVKKGARINTYNSISDVGYMGIVLKKYFSNEIFEMMMGLPDIAEVSATGRNAIHDAVAIEGLTINSYSYESLLKKLMDLGCDIFQQDSKGRTALHLAVHFQNDQGIEALLNCGADVNIVDLAGKSPFSYASEFRAAKNRGSSRDTNESVRKTLTAHLMKLRLVGLQVSDSNKKLLKAVLNKNKDVVDVGSLKTIVTRQLQDAAKIEMCARGFTFRDFLRPMGVVNNYSTLTRADRDSVDSFFKPAHDRHDLSQLEGLLRLQYRNAVDRSSLIAPAVEGLRRLCGFPLPDLCAEVIMMYLTNWDLKNIMVATTITYENPRMGVD